MRKPSIKRMDDWYFKELVDEYDDDLNRLYNFVTNPSTEYINRLKVIHPIRRISHSGSITEDDIQKLKLIWEKRKRLSEATRVGYHRKRQYNG